MPILKKLKLKTFEEKKHYNRLKTKKRQTKFVRKLAYLDVISISRA